MRISLLRHNTRIRRFRGECGSEGDERRTGARDRTRRLDRVPPAQAALQAEKRIERALIAYEKGHRAR